MVESLSSRSSTLLRSWCTKYSDLSRHLHIETCPTEADALGRDKFLRNRDAIHLKIQTIIELSAQDGELNITQVKVRLSELSAIPLAPVTPWCFDETSVIMFIRQYAWVMRKIRQTLLLLWSTRQTAYQARLNDLKAFEELFSEGVIPADTLCRVDREALNWRIPDTETMHERHAKYLQALVRRMEMGIRHFPKAVWDRSIDEFLWILAKAARPEPDTAYFPPGQLEFSLSCCLFNPESKQRPKIDLFLENIQGLRAPKFGEVLLGFCMDLSRELRKGSKRKFSGRDHMILVFRLFRVIFNRYYELDPGRFAPTNESDKFVKRVVRLSDGPAMEFNLPWDYLPNLEDRTIPIRELFQNDPIYGQSARSLSLALFEPNPMDQLFRMHTALLGVSRGADFHVHGANPVRGQPALLGFDDHFAIFFGIWLASEIPDAHYLKHVIEGCVPKAALSSPFEYALANLEAVVMHLRQLSADGQVE
jgi:hypothetical protein